MDVEWIDMRLNVAKNINKMMGWCPNADVFVTKRTLITRSSNQFLNGEKGNDSMDPIKMGWGNRYRNIILLMTILGITFFGAGLLIINFLFERNIHMGIMLKGILIGTIITPLIIFYQLKQYNRIDQINSFRTKKNFLKIFVEVAILCTVFNYLLFFSFGKDSPLDFMLGFILPTMLVEYPLVVYWERKNKKTIFLVEEKHIFYRPVVLHT